MTATIIQDELPQLQKCALDLFVGEYLGGGVSRRVWALVDNPYEVIKVEYAKSFCNMLEWTVWQEIQAVPEAAVWFAPCVRIDSWGMALIQKRTKPFESAEDFYAAAPELPWFFDDAHWANFGLLDGRVVCHDYGYNHFITACMKRGKMKPNKYAPPKPRKPRRPENKSQFSFGLGTP